MGLSKYHKKYVGQSDEEIKKRAEVKQQELTEIFGKVHLHSISDVVRIAVLGCGDKRFIKYHESIFAELLEKPVEIITFDIEIAHLDGEKNVIQHDCTLPLPNGPFDITYGHVVLRFVETDKQWSLIKNSLNALKVGGLAIHIMDSEDYTTKGDKLANGLYTVPIERWKNKLKEENIKYTEVSIEHGKALVLQKQ